MPQTTTFKKILGFCFWILCITTCFSQNGENDSTSMLDLKYKEDDLSRLEFLLEVAKKNFYSNPNKTEQYAKEALLIAKKHGNGLAEGDAYNILAQINSLQGKLNLALENQLKARDKYIALKNEQNITKSTINIGLIYHSQNNCQRALEYLKEATKLNSKLGNKEIDISININTGNIYASQKKFNKALFYFNKAEQLTIQLNDDFLLSIILVNLGEIYSNLKYYNLSIQYINHALDISTTLDDKEGLAIGYLFKAEVELKKNQLEESNASLNRSIKNAEEIENVETLAQAYLLRSTLDSINGHYKKSLMHFKKHKDLENVLDKQKIELTLDSIIYNNRLVKKDIELKQQNIKFQFLGFSVITLCLLVSFFIFHYTKTKKNNTALSTLNKDIKKQNETIKEQSNQLRLIANNVPAGIAYIDKNSKLLFINSTARDWINKPQNIDASNIDITGYFNDQNICERVLSGETVTVEDQTIFNDKTLFVQITCVPDFDDTNIAKGFILLIKDISSIKEAENAKLTAKNIEKQKLRSELDYRNRELFVRTMLISEKNNVLDKIKADLDKLLDLVEPKNVKKIKQIIHMINNSINQKDHWHVFKLSFERIHPLFFENLQLLCSDLSQNELKHCAYIKMSLTNKEVAKMLHIEPRSVEMARYRIKKKLNLDKKDSLQEYINSIET